MIFFTADIHFSDKKFKAIDYSFQYFLKQIKEKKPDIVIIGGDYFEKRLEPDSDIYKKAIGYLIEISKISTLIVIKGTHSHDANQLEILNKIKKLNNNIYYFDKFTITTINGIKFALIPEEYPENPEEYYKELYNTKVDLIIGHGVLSGAKLHNGIVNKYIKDLIFYSDKFEKNCKYNLWGHIHIPQKLSEKTYYVGALARWDFNEIENNRYLEIDEKNWTIKSIEVPTYTYLTITEKELEDNKEIYEELLKDEKVFIRFQGDIDNKTYLYLKEKYPEKIFLKKIIRKDNIENFIKYSEVINQKTIEEQYLYMIEEELKNKNFSKKQKEYLKKENIIDKIKELSNIEV